MPKYIVTWSVSGHQDLEAEVPKGATRDEIIEESLYKANVVKEYLEFENVLNIVEVKE